MKKLLCKFACVALSVCLVCGVAYGCSPDTTGGNVNPPDPGIDLNNGYTYTKQNDDGLMQFYSSDESLDSFLNEYMRRHLRYDDDAIGDLKLGEGNTVWKEWEAMSVMWMNTAGIGYSPKTSIGNWFSNIYQDSFGYIWVDAGTTTTDWGQSWQFPNMGHSGNSVSGEYYNTSYFNGLNDFKGYNGSSELTSIWKGRSNTGVNGSTVAAATGYSDYMTVSGKDIKSITFTYDAPQDGKIMWDGAELNIKPYMGTPFCSPFLELDFSITDYDSLGSTQQVEDVIVSWKGGSGTKNSEWDDDHCVRYSEFSTNYKETFSAATHIVFPMYAHENWGKSESLDDAITDMKIEIVFKDGINAEVRLEEVTLSFDGRQVNNNSVFIAAAAYYYQYTQDDEWLEKNIDKIRKAMQFLLTYCKGAEQELITVEEFVGHDGSSNYDYFAWKDEDGKVGSATNTGVGHGIGDGYWDCPSYPVVSLYCNLYYFKALKGMEYLEKMVAASGIEESGNAVEVKSADMKKTVKYTETAVTLGQKIQAFIPEFQEYFWNEETGRFHLGYLPETDKGVQAGVLDTVVDYGFTTYNQEAIELGLATEEQAASILSWINGDRIVEGDTADNSSRTKQIYYFTFAPRWTTKENVYQYWFRFDGKRSGSYGWNKQVQNGGTAAHCAYYDMVAEQIVNGGDAAFAKLKNVQGWYETVKEAGGTGKNFYRSYYLKNGIILQGGESSGVLGLDYEFIEATLLYTTVPAAFFGLSSSDYNCLNITPDLPSSLDYWKMENLSYADMYYDLSIGKNWVQINSIQGDTEGKTVRVTLDAPSGAFEVRQHNKILTAGTDYTVENGKVVIVAPFRNGRIQIVNK